MESNKRNIDEFFQEELGKTTEMPPASVWSTLEKRLDGQNPIPKKTAWWLIPLLAIVFIGGTIAAYFGTNKKTDASTISTINNRTNNQYPSASSTVLPNENITTQNQNTITPTLVSEKEKPANKSQKNNKKRAESNSQGNTTKQVAKGNTTQNQPRKEREQNAIAPKNKAQSTTNVAPKPSETKEMKKTSIVKKTTTSEEKIIANSKAKKDENKATKNTTGKPTKELTEEKRALTSNKKIIENQTKELKIIAKEIANNPTKDTATNNNKIDTALSLIPKIAKQHLLIFGAKAGYERGFENYTAGKFVGNIVAEWSLSNKVSFIFQPGIKFAKTNKQLTLKTENYYKITETEVDPYNRILDSFGNIIATDFAFSQSYDSILVMEQTKEEYIELELPLLIRYKINKQLSMLGGVNFSFGKTLGFSSSVNTIGKFLLRDTLLNQKDTVAPEPTSRFPHTGSTAFSNYKENTSTSINPFRVGYTLGIAYQIKERLTLDLIMQQNLSKLNAITDPNLRKLYTQPYFRISVGYTIFGLKQK